MSEAKPPAEADPATRLLNGLAQKGITELKPKHDHNHGCVYPEVEEILGVSRPEALKIVEDMVARGVLERELADKLVVCPKCKSTRVRLRFLCPYCKSFTLSRKSLLEHFRCGNIAIEDQFQTDEGLVCPKCRGKLKEAGVDYRVAGLWTECDSCKKRFDQPTNILHCDNCDVDSALKELHLRDCWTYKVAKTAGGQITKVASLKRLVDTFADLGYSVESPGKVVGNSGAEHTFDIISTAAGKKRVVVDVVQGEGSTVSEQPVISMFAKIFDLDNSQAVVIASPRLSENGKKLAPKYQIATIEAPNIDDAARQLRRLLEG